MCYRRHVWWHSGHLTQWCWARDCCVNLAVCGLVPSYCRIPSSWGKLFCMDSTTTSASTLHTLARLHCDETQVAFCCYMFLAHLSTKCSWWAIVVSGLSVVRRRPSCVVRRASTFDVYTLETTFVIRFYETLSECLFWQYLGQVRIWVMSV